MKIVILTPTLYVNNSPFNHLLKDIIENLLAAGNEIIRIVACDSLGEDNYKLGVESSKISYIPILRNKIKKSSMIWRFVLDNMISIRMSIILSKLKNIDLILEDVSYSSLWPVRAAKRKFIRVISMIQDVWPDNAVESKIIIRHSLLHKIFESIQNHIYEHSDMIICISNDIRDLLINKGIPENKISVVYNWSYYDHVEDILWDNNIFVKKYNLETEKFYAVYAGNIGRMQNVELIIRAANNLKANKNIMFLIIGDGVNRSNIEALIRENSLNNVRMIPMQPSDLATSIYSMAGINIIPLVQGGIKTALPSKTAMCLSCGKPIIFCIDSESKFAQMIETYKCGIIVDPNKDEQLSSAIQSIYENKIVVDKNNMYRIYREMFSKNVNVSKYIEVINKCIYE